MSVVYEVNPVVDNDIAEQFRGTCRCVALGVSRVSVPRLRTRGLLPWRRVAGRPHQGYSRAARLRVGRDVHRRTVR